MDCPSMYNLYKEDAQIKVYDVYLNKMRYSQFN